MGNQELKEQNFLVQKKKKKARHLEAKKQTKERTHSNTFAVKQCELRDPDYKETNYFACLK